MLGPASMRLRAWALVLFAILLVLAAGSFLRQPDKAPVAPTERGVFAELAPPAPFFGFELVDGTGAPADLGPYRGKALLVNAWATWCAPCVAELPSLARLEEKLRGRDFAVLPIAIDERDPAKVAEFLERHRIDLPALIDLKRGLDSVARVTALPTSLLVDRDGLVRAVFVGDTRWDCGKPLQAIEAFVASGAISREVLEPCE